MNIISRDARRAGKEVTKDSPCPICNKPDWCLWLDDGLAINCKRSDTASEDWTPAKTKPKEGEIFIPVQKWEKTPRAKQHREWTYQDANGKALIQVKRTDDGNGNKKIHQKSLVSGKRPAELKKQVMPYRYLECLELAKQGKQIFWVEGESCVDALWSIGIPATTTIGGSKGYNSEQYSKLFPGNVLVICPDRDKPGLKYAEAIAQDYPEAQWCYAFPDSPLWSRLNSNSGADVADWIEAGTTAEDICNAVGPRRELDGARSQPKPNTSEGSDQPKFNRLKKAYHNVQALWGERLAYNEYSKEIELNESPIDIGKAKLRLAVDHDCLISIENLELILMDLAERNAYHPVRDYLEQCHHNYGESDILESLSQRYFGTVEPIYDAYLKRTLIGAVARIFEPGCKFDTALILQGGQGIGKSTFFKILAGGDSYFDDSLGAASDKDERLKLHLSWILEWAELESIFKRKDIAQTKAFITSSVDNVRPPYGRQAIRLARQSIIVGSTNQDEFLSDSTGNRRFWVIPVRWAIDLELLRAERDQIWAAAVAAYRAGEKPFLSPEERNQAAEAVKDYQASDPWQSRIEAYLLKGRLSVVTTTDILENCLQLDIQQQGRREQMRVANILKTLGWRREKVTLFGKRRWGYVKPEPPAESPAQLEDEGCDLTDKKPSLTDEQLCNFMDWNLDQPDRYQTELAKLSTHQVDYLYQRLPELRPLQEGQRCLETTT